MMRTYLRLIFSTLLIGGLCAAADALPGNTTRYDFSALSAQLQTFISSGAETGFTFVLVKDGEIVFEQGFGNYTTTKVTSIASASKMPTTFAVMKLVDGGQLKLSDKVSQYIPNWPADKAEMTVAHLLSCTSGFPFDQSAVNDKTITLEQAVQEIAQMPLLFPPGTQFAYNPNGFQVAARIVEIVTGKSWNTHFKDTLFNPLSMTTFVYSGASNPWVAGGVSTNSEDYVKILALHLNQGWWKSGRLYEPETVAAMQQDYIGSKPIYSSPAPNDNWHYGLSWWLSPPTAGEPVTEISDQGAFGTTPWLDLKRNYGGFILINKTTVDGNAIWNAARPIINGILDNAIEPPSVRLQPVDATVNPGDAAVFYALGAGRGPLTYQWQKDGVNIPGATKSNFRVNPVSAADAGSYRVVITNSLNGVASKGATLTVPPPPSAPVIVSSPVATPNPATVSQSVSFFVAATNSNGAPLFYAWDFGDSSLDTGSNVAHSYATSGTFTANVIVSDASGNTVSGSVSVVVTAAEGGGASTPGDSDGDGVSDVDELAAGTDPNDPSSGPMRPLTVTALKGTAKFGVENKDTVRVSGIVSGLPAQFKTDGVAVLMNVGGATKAFTLNAKGVAKDAGGSFSIKLKLLHDKATKTKYFPGGDAPFKAMLGKGTWSDDWMDEGLAGDIDAKNVPMQMGVRLTLNGQLYDVTVDTALKEKAGKSAAFGMVK